MRPATRHAASPTRADRPRRWLSASAAVVLALVTFVGPASAAQPARATALSSAGIRPQTTHQISSVRDAARRSVGVPRATAAAASPLRSAKITAKPSAGGVLRTGSSSAATTTNTPVPATVQVAAVADVQVLQQRAGLTQSDAGGSDPPDPWIAVNSSFVVQSVTGKIRISNRAGVEQTSITTAAFLGGLPITQSPSNLRVIWDATHGRWIASALSVNAAKDDNFLHLAISNGADPTAGWRIISTSFGTSLPDYPALASSNDKIVVTDNLFGPTSTPVGADLNTWTWSSILAGGALTYNHCTTDGTRFNARPAQVLSSATDVHLIMEAVPSGEQWYYRLTANGQCSDLKDGTDLTLFKPFTVPPAPRQLTADTITNAVDERPTDAVWQNGQMWWVSTYPWSYDGGATFNDVVVLWNVTTTASGSPVSPTAQAIAPGDGFDTFMGGIGMSRDGSLFTVYSQSSSTNFVYLMADRVPPGLVLGEPIQLAYGGTSATSENWGTFAGVAMDPVGSGTVWATHQLAAPITGAWQTQVVRLSADHTAPTTPGPVITRPMTSTTVGSRISASISWGASSDAGTGVASYQVYESVDGGAFAPLGSQTATSITRSQAINHTYRYRVHATDTAGNVSADSTGPSVKPTLTQQAPPSGYSSGWGTGTNSSYSGGTTRYASRAGAWVSYTTTGARSLAIVATKAASRGSFKVYVDGVYKGTISTYSTTTRYRQLVYQFTWSTAGTHRIKVVVVGTFHHPRVDVDAFLVLR